MHGEDPAQGGHFLLHAPGADDVGIIAHVESAGGPAEIHHILHVDLADGQAVLTLVGGQDLAVFRHQAQAGEHVIRSALSLAGGGHHHAAVEPAGQEADVQLRLVGGADGLREGGHLGDNGGAGEGMAQGRRGHRVHIGAQLHRNRQAREQLVFKQHIGEEGHTLPADDHLYGLLVGHGKVAAVHIGPGHQTQQLPVAHGGGAAVEPGAGGDGQAHKAEHIHAPGGLHHPQQRLLGALQDHPVADDVIAAAAGEAQLRKHQDLYALFRGVLDTVYDLAGIIVGVCHLNHRGGGSNLDKTMLHCTFT